MTGLKLILMSVYMKYEMLNCVLVACVTKAKSDYMTFCLAQ